MNTKHWRSTIGLMLMLLVNSCVEPYLPEVMEAPNSYLVVNGFINADGQTTIQLLRSQNLNEETPPPTEDGAIVMIEAEDGEQYRLAQSKSGVYVSANLTLDQQKKYRLFIRTKGGKEYASDYVVVKVTPAIDSITWGTGEKDVQIFVNTHDNNNDTRYYRWEYEDTWHYRSAFSTILKYENGVVSYTDEDDEDLYNCWRTEHSTTVMLSNSQDLSKDVINNFRIVTLPSNSEKIAIRYSVLVKQFALTKEAFEYWQILKKNTENIGTLFDPLPSQLKSNIHGITDPKEVVIGHVSVSTVQEKRIFINEEELPREWRTFIPTCYSDTLYFGRGGYNVKDYFDDGFNMPVSEVYAENSPVLIGYVYAARPCVDCTTRGTNVKPDFWE